MRQIAHLAAVMACMAASVAGIALVAAMYSRMEERDRTYRFISEALSPIADVATVVSWQKPSMPLVRDFTEVEEENAGRAIGEAWRAHAAAMALGRTDVLPDYFSGVALTRATLSAEMAFGEHAQMVFIEELAQPEFYHLDGSVLQVGGEAVIVRFVDGADGLQHFEISRDRVVTTLMNETTGWRIFSHERSASHPFASDAPEPPEGPERLAGINYYPSGTPWTRFWPDFDAGVVAADFDLVAELGGNAVRIFLPVADFTGDGRDAALEKLRVLLALAEARDLSVVPTLFDLKPDFAPAAWADDVLYLRAVVPVLASSDAVAMIDLKNEPDLDFAREGRGRIEAWLRTMSAYVRQLAPRSPQTIGWSSADAAPFLGETLDVISYHDYAPAGAAGQRLDGLRARFPGKPIHVTEIGQSSYTLFAGLPGSPREQAKSLHERLDALKFADGIFVWTLHDFRETDPAAIGSSPWVKRLQAHFGLIDAEGRTKPAHAVVAAAFRQFLSGDS